MSEKENSTLFVCYVFIMNFYLRAQGGGAQRSVISLGEKKKKEKETRTFRVMKRRSPEICTGFP